MDSSFLPGWLGSKLNVGDSPSKGNVAASWQWRELGMNPRGSASNSRILQEAAEDHLVNKAQLSERCCELPGIPKSTFLMVFSPDGTKVASTHGNHKIYVSELSSGKHVKTLSGHPRTPWCIAFHPSHPRLLGSGCLGGQVRVWDLSGGSEVWTVSGKTVIASIAFHPRDRLLVIATYNELYFWDWVHPQPFTKVQTNTIKEKVRFVSFDPLGHKLITGISVWSFPGAPGSLLQPSGGPPAGGTSPHHPSHGPSPNLPHEHNSTYHHLLQRYDSLVRSYRHLFRVRSQLSTTDRGTDPMEVDPGGQASSSAGAEGPASRSAPTRAPAVDTSSNPDNSDSDDASEGTGGSLNLDVQSISLGNTPGTRNSSQARHEIPMTDTMTFVTTNVPRVSYMAMPRERLFGSGANQSAFRPLSESNNPARTPDVSESANQAQSDPSRASSVPPDDRLPISFSALVRSLRRSNPPNNLANITPNPTSNQTLNPSPISTSNPTPNPASNASIRSELTASLNRLQGFMENSIDETLNIIERSDSARTSPMYSSMNVLREFPLLRNPTNASSRRLHMTPPTNSFVRNPQVHSHGARPSGDCSYTTSHGSRVQQWLNSNDDNPNGSQPPGPRQPSQAPQTPQTPQTTQAGQPRQDPPQDINIEQRFDSIGSMMRDSRIRLLNLITEFTEFSTIRRILQHYQQQRNTQANPNTTEASGERINPHSPIVTGIFSSDDGSDSDRDMFSPLPLHIYRTRNWNASSIPPPPPYSSSFGNVFEPTQTSSISMHIDNEDRHFRRHLLPNGDEQDYFPNGLEAARSVFTSLNYPSFANVFRSPTQLDTNAPSTSRQAQQSVSAPTQQPVPPQTEPRQTELPAQEPTPEPNPEEPVQGPSNQPALRQSQHTLQRLAQQLTQRTRTSSAPALEGSQRDNAGECAFVKVTRGVQAIKQHTEALVTLCSTNVSRPPLRQLRRMWEDLRRVIVTIHQPSSAGRGPASCFSLSAHTRCRLLNYISSSLTDRNRNSRNRASNDSTSTRAQASHRQVAANTSSSNVPTTSQSDSGASGSQTNTEPSTSSGSRHGIAPRSRHLKTNPLSSRLCNSNFGFSPQDLNQSMRRRIRSLVLNRLRHTSVQRWHLSRGHRRSLRNRSPYRQELEISRDTIRFHARRVLALMFNTMMQCLEAEHLGTQIIVMLRSLKKALGLTCLLLMSQPFPNESHRSNAAAGQGATSSTRESQPSTSNSPATNMEESEANEGAAPAAPAPDPPSDPQPSSSWIDRIAIQISAANRNTSSKAKKRQERYNIFKRSQALRNRNPSIRSHSSKKALSNNVPAAIGTGTGTGTSLHSERRLDRSVPLPVEDNAVPSTSGLQRGNDPANRSENNPSPPARSSQLNARRFYSRMLFRRYLYNYGFMRDTTNILRTPENQRTQNSSDVEFQNFSPVSGPRILSVRGAPSTRSDNNTVNVVIDSFISNVVPIVRVNDVPVSEVQQDPRINAFPQPPTPPYPSREQPVIPQNIMSVDENGGAGILDGSQSLITDTPESPVHRIQVWDFTQGQLPDICNANINVVVQKCKIHNDASIDISRDGRLLVALLPAQRMRNITHRLGIYSLEWNCLGECLYTALLEQNAVSISLSPCARHLAVGLGSRRVSLQPYGRNGIMALIFRLGALKKNDNNSRRGCLIPIRSLEQSWELGFTSLNCLRWAPQPGQGLVYANNTGQLKILS